MDSDNNKDLSSDLDFEIVTPDDEKEDDKEESGAASGEAVVTPPPASGIGSSSMSLEDAPLDMDDVSDLDMDDSSDDPTSSYDLGDEDEGLEEISGVSAMDDAEDADFSDLDDMGSDDDFSNDLADYSDYDLSGGGEDDMDDDLVSAGDGMGANIGGDSDAFFASRPGGAAFASSAQKGKGGSKSRKLLLILLLVLVVGGGGLYFMSATTTPGIQMPPPQPAQVAQMDQQGQQGFDQSGANVNTNQPFANSGLADDQQAQMADPNAMAAPDMMNDPSVVGAPDPFADPNAMAPTPAPMDDAQMGAVDPSQMQPQPQDQTAAVDPMQVDPFTGEPIAQPAAVDANAPAEQPQDGAMDSADAMDAALTPNPTEAPAPEDAAGDPLADGMAALDNAVADLEAQDAAQAVDPALTVSPEQAVFPPQNDLVDPNTQAQAQQAAMPSANTQGAGAADMAATPTPDQMASAANAGSPLPMPKQASNTVFFDSAREARVAENSLQEQGPELVDPMTLTASRYVVVQNVVSADSQESERTAAQRALSLGRYDAALSFYENMYAKNQRDPRILMGYALALQKTGRVDEAIDKYDELLDVSPGNTEALVNVMGLVQQQNPQAAIQALEELRAKNPSNAGVAAQLGIAYATAGDYASARKYLGAAASIDPKNAMTFYNLGNISEREGKRSDAVRYYEKALEVDAIYGSGRSVPRDTIYDRLALLR